MVLKENMEVKAGREKGKFEMTWLGLYVVTKYFSSRAYQNLDIEGENLDDLTNIIHLKKFYI